MPQKLVYHWKHGWIPLTHAAALSKAHGNVKLADRYVKGASEHHGSMRTRGRSARAIHGGLDAHRTAIAQRDMSTLSDEKMSELLTEAATSGTPEDLDAVVAELDRRDVAERVAAKMAAKRDAALRRRDAQQKAMDDEFDRMVSAGDDPESAYAKAFGVSVERQRREQVIASLRQDGYKGAGFDELSRAAYRAELDRMYFVAEDHTRGAMLNNDGRRRGVSTRSLFTGNEAVARRYASEELKQFWDDHGRLTLADFRASLLGGSIKERTTGDSWHQ